MTVNRSRLFVAAGVAAFITVAGATFVAAAPVPAPDPCDESARDYLACRLDRIEAAIPDGAGTVTVTAGADTTVTETADPVTVTEVPDPVTETATVTEVPAPVTETVAVTETQPAVTVTATPAPVTVTATVTATPPAPPVTTTPVSSTSAAPTTTAPPVPPAAFPDASNTGVPAGVTLTVYTGPCTITAANTVIDSKTINCDLDIRTSGVLVKNSKLNGTIATAYDSTGHGFTVEDTEINAGNRGVTAVGEKNFTLLRVHIYGGNRSIHCYNTCLVQDTYTHGQWVSATVRTHASGTRMGQNGVFRHNSFTCDANDNSVGSGCSASFTGYGDFTAVTNNLIENNLFKATTGGYCAYGGSSGGKPYTNGARDIRFINNVFERGNDSGKCGWWGAITDFDGSKPGNAWSGNKWDNGAVLNP